MTKEEVKYLLLEDKNLIDKAHEIKGSQVGHTSYLRGLIELSNECVKDCLYCGIRKSNTAVNRYTLSEESVLSAAQYAFDNNYGSIALQAGERFSSSYVSFITSLVSKIKDMTNGELGVTLSLGEQSEKTLREWFAAGAERYLLRIESSREGLYREIHPKDELHSFSKRLAALYTLKGIGYQLGTGVMIGLPSQSVDDLVSDLLFMRELDIDMCGMGPYLEHEATPLYAQRGGLWSMSERFDMAIRMVATLRVLMPKINIAATTALQAIDPLGREKALWAGANVIMPNITPLGTRAEYKLYENKPMSEDCLDVQSHTLYERIRAMGDTIGFGLKGNSLHYKDKNNIKG